MKNAILDDIFKHTPPDILYHYTNQAGFLGIVTDKEIWATQTQYLNDRQEFLYAVGRVRQHIQGLLESGKYDENDVFLLRDMHADVEEHSGLNVCVCSFSQGPESLAQWRAYGGDSGFAIGFAGKFLTEVARRNETYLAPCIYDPSKQDEIISALVNEVLEENRERANNGREVYLPKGGNLYAYLNRFAPVLKDKAFALEKEWRIISTPVPFSRMEFRQGRSMLTPFYRLPLRFEEMPFEICEVIIGPTPHPNQSRQSAFGLLVKNKVKNKLDEHPNLKSSAVPFRNW